MKNNILLLLVTIPLFLFITKDTIAFGYSDSEYKGKKPLIEKHISRHIGKGIGWVESCGRGGKARDLRNEIKFLSYADFREINLGYGEWQSGGKYAIGCDADLRAISEIEKYIQDLKHRVNAKNKTSSSSNVSKDSKNKKTGSKSTYCKKLNGDIYETQRNYCTTSERVSSKQEYVNSISSTSKTTQVTQNNWRYCQNKYNEKLLSRRYNKCDGSEIAISKIKYDNIKSGKTSTTNDKLYCLDEKANRVFYYIKSEVGSCFSDQLEISKTDFENVRSGKTTAAAVALQTTQVTQNNWRYCQNKYNEKLLSRRYNKCDGSEIAISKIKYDNIKSGKKTVPSLDCSTIPEAELTTIVNQAQCPNEIALREDQRNKKTASKGLKYCLGKKGTYSTFKNCSSASREITRQEYDSINNQPTFSIESMLKDLRGEEINYYYTTANVRIRSQATIDSSILTTVPADQVVNVHSMLTSDNDWWLVEFNMVFGYMDKSYLSRDKITNDSKIIDEKPINAQGYNQSDIFKERLKDLKELFDLDLITQQEYDQKKQSILDLL